jgi:hypothetical protein
MCTGMNSFVPYPWTSKHTVHLSMDRILNLCVYRKLALHLKCNEPNEFFAGSIWCSRIFIVDDSQPLYCTPYINGSRYLLLFIRAEIDGTERKVNILMSEDCAIYVVSLKADPCMYQDTILDCLYDSATNTMNVVDVYIANGQLHHNTIQDRSRLAFFISIILEFSNKDTDALFHFKSAIWTPLTSHTSNCPLLISDTQPAVFTKYF